MMTSGSELSLNFRWPYQAKVMKTLEAHSIRIGRIDGEMVGINILLARSRALTIRHGTLFHRRVPLSFDLKTAKVFPDRSTTASGCDLNKPPPLEISGEISGKLPALFREATRTGMQFDWRAISGPALTTATALTAFFVDRHVIAVPNPAPLFVCIVAFASSVSGIASGLVSAAIALASSALFFLNHRPLPGYDMSDLAP